MTARPIRVLVVDDSAFARKVMREVLSADASIEVVGIARDGLDALEMIETQKPDVVTLDLVMPNLDGLGVLRALAGRSAPRCIVVSTSDEQSDLAVQALVEGAVDVVHKPTALATDRLYDLASELVYKVKVAFAARTEPPPVAPLAPATAAPRSASPIRAVVLGTSTGGPQALTQLVAALPRDFPVPLAMVLHIPIGYTASLAKRLDEISAVDVVEAYEGLVLRPGLAVLARAGLQMDLVRDSGDNSSCRVRLREGAPDTPHVPSVDFLFEAAARVFGSALLGVVLTGMGQDGLTGSRAIRAAGGLVFSESASSCVVYGMPRAVYEAGLSHQVVPLSGMAAAIVQAL